MRKSAFAAAMILISITLSGQNLQKGTLLGHHSGEVILNPDVTMNQYLSFLKEKLIPGYEKNFPGMKVYVLKGIRGESANAVSILMAFPSESVRDKYFKPDGGFSELGEAANKNMTSVYEEGNKYLKNWEADKYTDWLVQ
jgi:hypothetical protein